MKRTIFILELVLVVLVLCLVGNGKVVAMMCHGGGGSEHQHKEKSSEKAEGKKVEVKESFYSTIYVCPMHPEVQQEKSGKCPKCSMKLEKKQVLMTYACPEKDCEYQKASLRKCPEHKKELIKCEIKSFCPKCGEQINPEELKQKPVKPQVSASTEIILRKANEDEIGKEVTCPVMGTKFTVKSITEIADYKGKSYYFCCAECPSEFKKVPDKYAK